MAQILFLLKKSIGSSSFKLDAPWEIVKERLKENNIELTDEYLNYEPGNEEELLEHLQAKINKPKDGIKSLIESISFNSERAG